MSEEIQIKSALISVFHKEGLDIIIGGLTQLGVSIYSTGGTAKYIESLGAEVHSIEQLTGYPSILGGRVKTLHPKVHGGILARREVDTDIAELQQYDIPLFDLIIVDLYPFEETVASAATPEAIIEKIDIGGIALIRAAAKNFKHSLIVPSQDYYSALGEIIEHGGTTSLAQRKAFAAAAFGVSSHYDTHIYKYLADGVEDQQAPLKISINDPKVLRYGENPHQKGYFYGDLDSLFEQLNGKALSYNNLVDIDGALQLVDEFNEPFFAIIKHTNPCGCSIGDTLEDAWQKALAGDPVSAFGGILACNGKVEAALAEEIHELFFEVLIANDFSPEALEILSKKKNRILLSRKDKKHSNPIIKGMLNGYLAQERDTLGTHQEQWEIKTPRTPTEAEKKDIAFGELVCKHLKSNAIALVKNQQLIGSGIGQTSRIDALNQAVDKAKRMGFELKGSVLASDAFFPFKDSVELANSHGIEIVVEPGGSRKDQETIDFCVNHNMCLIFTGTRHFKH